MQFKHELAYMALGVVLAMIGLFAMASISWAEGYGWTTKADMLTPRYGLSTSVVNGKIYAIGGSSTARVSRSEVEAYDPVTDTWTPKAPMPTARQWLSTSVVNGKIYAIGGEPSFAAAPVPTVEEYDPVTDTWTPKAPMPTARGALSTSVVNGKIYAIGGSTGVLPEASAPVPTVEEYDPVTDAWTTRAPVPEAKADLSTSVVNGKIYAIFWPYATYEYDPTTDSWTAKAQMPRQRSSFSTSVVGDKIYVIGGARGGFGGDPFPWVDEYDPATDTWTTKPDMPMARGHLSTSAVNGKIYAIGGSTTGRPLHACSTVEQYDPAVGMEIERLAEGLVSATETLGATWIGQSTPLEIAVVLDAPLETTESLRKMILDLSLLGIPSGLALEHAGDGRYTASTTVTPLRHGHHNLPILLETTEGERYPFVTVTLEVYVEHEYLYQDDMGPRWEVKVSAGELDLKASDLVHEGSYSQAINSQSGGYVQYTCTDPDGFSTFGYTCLHFWINPGTSSTEKAVLGLSRTEGLKYLKLGYHLGITLEPNVWQVVSIPLEDVGLVDTRLKYIQLRGVEGTFHIDDLGLVVAEYGLAGAAATPEKVKPDGKMPTILTVQAVPAVAQPGAPPTVTIDLTPIGGKEDAMMADDGTRGDKAAGDGIYSIQTTVDPEIQNGLKDLLITSTDSRLRVACSHLSVGVLPTEDKHIYQDEVEAGWKLWFYNAEANPKSTDYVHSGSYAQAITLRAGGYVGYMVEDPDGLTAFGYVLEFWLNPGTASIEELKIVAYRRVGKDLKTRALPLVEQLGISFEPETWQQVSIPAEALELTDGNLEKIRFVGDVQGTFYIDDMRLVPEEVEIPPVAVEEVSQATAVPLGYALSQNYPNPFNAGTTIAFDLPSPAKVNLSVYSLAGQKVRTLVSGVKGPGGYLVTWDGEDEVGRDVASGIYFYRLEAGEFAEARRMLLLK